MAFSLSGSRLADRVREKAFECLLRQEVAYFDRPENRTGAIVCRLSTNATVIEQMAGIRLGIVCEMLVIAIVSLILGWSVSWELSMIVFICISITVVLIYVNLRYQEQQKNRSSSLKERAGSVCIIVFCKCS